MYFLLLSGPGSRLSSSPVNIVKSSCSTFIFAKIVNQNSHQSMAFLEYFGYFLEYFLEYFFKYFLGYFWVLEAAPANIVKLSSGAQ